MQPFEPGSPGSEDTRRAGVGHLAALVLLCIAGWFTGWFAYAFFAILPDTDQREIPWLLPAVAALIVLAFLGVALLAIRWWHKTVLRDLKMQVRRRWLPWLLLGGSALAAVLFRIISLQLFIQQWG